MSAAPGDVGALDIRCGRCGIGVAGVADVVGSGAAGSASVGGVRGGGGGVVSTRALARACGVVLCDPERRARPGTVARARALEPVRGLFRVERNATAFHGIYLESVSRSPVRRRVWDTYGRPSPFGTRTVPAPPVTASAAAAPTVPMTVVPVSPVIALPVIALPVIALPVTAPPVTASAGEGAR
ncbi:hypothetical protein [Streptomyces uncialis]|uniref:hypothetical protein n=1 Tax=Streptomyces uncialis TaxID=1048205 RepID=UPI0037BBFED1